MDECLHNVVQIEPILLKPKQAAAALGMCERTLYSLTAPRGDIPAVYVNGKVFGYYLPHLHEWAEKKSLESAESA